MTCRVIRGCFVPLTSATERPTRSSINIGLFEALRCHSFGGFPQPSTGRDRGFVHSLREARAGAALLRIAIVEKRNRGRDRPRSTSGAEQW
ncbi:MAG: hypothetical protein ACXW2P_12170, partial [Thermoanaerobaculia bacterium]